MNYVDGHTHVVDSILRVDMMLDNYVLSIHKNALPVEGERFVRVCSFSLSEFND